MHVWIPQIWLSLSWSTSLVPEASYQPVAMVAAAAAAADSGKADGWLAHELLSSRLGTTSKRLAALEEADSSLFWRHSTANISGLGWTAKTAKLA